MKSVTFALAAMLITAFAGKTASACDLNFGQSLATATALNLLLDAKQDLKMVSSKTNEIRGFSQVIGYPKANGSYTIAVYTSDNQWEVVDISEIRVLNMTTSKSVDLGEAANCK